MRATSRIPVQHELRAAVRPATATTHYVPRTHKADVQVCSYDEMTHHEPRATSRELLLPPLGGGNHRPEGGCLRNGR